MNKWLLGIVSISFFLLGVLKAEELNTLHPFYKSESFIKLTHFQKAKENLNISEQELLELWESMLTGRSGPVSKWIKLQYKSLGLNHLFTPSGFHLTALIGPFNHFFPKSKLWLLLLMGITLAFLPGQAALKRMVLIKGNQNFFGMKLGFIIALCIDVCFGNFQNSTLSFTYSFLFLGIVYSGMEGLYLIFWFFSAQMILAYFQGNQISILLLLFSPLLNFAFGLAMPLLFLLSFPLAHWQLHSGLFILKILNFLVTFSGKIISTLPLIEVNFCTLIILSLFMLQKKRCFIFCLLFFHNSLNLDLQRIPTATRYEFSPCGIKKKIINKSDYDLIYFSDGKCRRKLIRGYWWENCSPKRGSIKA